VDFGALFFAPPAEFVILTALIAYHGTARGAATQILTDITCCLIGTRSLVGISSHAEHCTQEDQRYKNHDVSNNVLSQ